MSLKLKRYAGYLSSAAGIAKTGYGLYKMGKSMRRDIKGGPRSMPKRRLRRVRPSKRRGRGGGSKARGCTKKLKQCIEREISKSNSTGHYTKRYTAQLKTDVYGASNIDANNLQTVENRVFRDGSPSGITGGGPSHAITNKIIDAVAILFNGKTASIDYTNGTGNFAETKNLKFHIHYISTKYTLKNDTMQSWDFTVYHGKHKGLTNDDMVTDWTNGMSALNKVGGGGTSPYTLGLTMGQVPQMKKNWNYKTKHFVIRPGETKTMLFLKETATLFDGEKLYDGLALKNGRPGSEEIMFVYHALLNRCAGTDGGADADTIGHFRGVDLRQYGLEVEVEEKYVLDAPSVTTVALDQDSYCFFNDFQAKTPTIPTITELYPKNPFLTTNTAA